MPYHETIQFEAQYVDDLGSSAPEDKFRGTYNAIILHWFPSTRGYLVDLQVLGDGGEPKYVVVCHNGGYRNPLIIVNLKPPSEWTAAGKDKVWLELQSNIEGLFDLTKFDTIYGVAGIGLHWMACKMDRLAGHQATQLLDWQDNIASESSYTQFQTIANLVYSLHEQ